MCASDPVPRLPVSAGAQLLEVLVAELAAYGGSPMHGVVLALSQLPPRDLARDRLRQLHELEPPYPQVRRQVVAREGEDRQRRLARRLVADGERDVGLGYGEPHRVG